MKTNRGSRGADRVELATAALRALAPRLCFSPHLSQDLAIGVFRYAGVSGRRISSLACFRFQQLISFGRGRQLFRVRVREVAAGTAYTAAITADGEMFLTLTQTASLTLNASSNPMENQS